MTHREKLPVTSLRLGEMNKGQGGYICRIEGPEAIVHRLLEMGMVEEAFVEVIHEAPFGKDPLAVRVRGSLLALRRKEAHCVTVLKVA